MAIDIVSDTYDLDLAKQKTTDLYFLVPIIEYSYIIIKHHEYIT